MIQREGHFQYLVALAVAGQITDTELEELTDHTASCSACSQRMVEMESANFQLFLSLGPQIKKSGISSGMQDRFVIRAMHSGVRITAPSSGFRHPSFLHFAALLVAVCLFSGLGWRQVTQGSLRRAPDSAMPVKDSAPNHFSAIADSELVLSKAPVAGRSSTRSIHRNHRVPGRAANLSSIAMSEESRVATQPSLRLNTFFLPSQPRTTNAEAKLSNFTDLPVEYLSPKGENRKPSFFTPAIWNSNANGVSNKRVFRYTATLASVSLQDDQVVFGLKPRVRDISVRDTLDSTRAR